MVALLDSNPYLSESSKNALSVAAGMAKVHGSEVRLDLG